MASKGGKLGADAQTAAEVKPQFKSLTEEAIRGYTDSGSFSKGQQYARNGYVVDATLRGTSLRARSMGRSGGPYKVQVELVGVSDSQSKPLGAYSCSCPRGGFCKHIVALLLVWVNSPHEIEVKADITVLLKDRTREELLAIISDLLKREPDLDRWIEIALVTSTKEPGSGGKLTVNPSTIKRQAAAMFSNLTYEWGEASDIADKLDTLVEMADRYADAGQWANAQAVYSAIAEAVAAEAGEIEDEEGDLDGVMSDCAEGLRRCIDAQAALDPAERLTSETRLKLFRSLFDIWQKTLDYGSLNMDEDVADLIARTATEAERAEVEKWVEAESPSAGKWGVSAHFHFLLTLKEKDGLSDEETLDMYRQAGLYEDLAHKLVELGRVDEALSIARQSLKSPHQATKLASIMLEQEPKHQERALKFVEDLLWEEKDKRDEEAYLRWLEERYLQYGIADKALDAALRRFQADPGIYTYASVKQAAHIEGQSPNLWAEKRPGLISALEAKGNWDALVHVYLSEEKVIEALTVLNRLEIARPRSALGGTGWGGNYLDAGLTDAQQRVAKAAERDYPNEARTVYQRLAERYIDVRTRDSYQQAAEVIVQVKALYAKQGEDDEWRAYIANLRTEYKTLRALKEELDSRGLV